MNDILLYFSLKYSGDWDLIYKAIEKKEKVSETDILEITPQAKECSLALTEKKFPESLKEVHKPPFVLFYWGNIQLINQYYRSVGIITNPNPSSYQNKAYKNFIKFFNKNSPLLIFKANLPLCENIEKLIINKKEIIIVTDLPLKEFLEKNQNLLNKMQNFESLLIISEYYQSKKENTEFPFFERLFVGLSKGVLIIGGENSASFKTIIKLLNDGDKLIFAIPEEIFSKSKTNILIKNGAILVESGSDILNEL